MITLNVSTEQEAFDAVVLQLSKQKFRVYEQVTGDDKVDSATATCMYRLAGAEPGNDRCAIGGLIPDDQYDPKIERLGIGDLIKDGAVFTALDMNFLALLQEVHDQKYHWNPGGGLNLEGWAKLDAIARDYGLRFTRP